MRQIRARVGWQHVAAAAERQREQHAQRTAVTAVPPRSPRSGLCIHYLVKVQATLLARRGRSEYAHDGNAVDRCALQAREAHVEPRDWWGEVVVE